MGNRSGVRTSDSWNVSAKGYDMRYRHNTKVTGMKRVRGEVSEYVLVEVMTIGKKRRKCGEVIAMMFQMALHLIED